MSSTGQATSSTSNIKLFTDALADYARITGVDLSTNPFASTLEQSDSLEAILQLLQERETAFKKFRKKYRRLINCVTPCFQALHVISGTLGEALSLPLVSYACHLVNRFNVTLVSSTSHQQRPCSLPSIFSSSYVPSIRSLNSSLVMNEFQTASRVSSSYDALLNLFQSLGNFLNRLEVYTTIPPTEMVPVTDIIMKILIELLSVLALATKEINQGRFSKRAVTDALLLVLNVSQ